MDPAAELQAALERIYAWIDAKAEEQVRWYKAARETMNRSIGQRARWRKGV